MELPADNTMLPMIDTALASQRWLITMPPGLAPRYLREQLAARQPHNRRVLLITAIIFNLFWFAQFKTAPEILPLSALLRFALMSPAVLLFLVLDSRGLLDRIYGPCLVTLGVMAGIITAILTVRTHGTTMTNLSDVRATPLILLATGLVMRLTPVEVVSTAALSVAVFIGSILLAPSVPGSEIGSLVLMDLAIGAAAVVFNLQLEARDRQLFLWRASERIHRAELAARNRGLLRETQTDGLTGVANRRFFDETLNEVWRRAQLEGGEVSLIMMDIDHFKLFNDHYGHQGGDECLRRVAAQARREVRGNDLFARYGGEEFAVILPDAPPAIANAVAERIRAAVEAMALPHAGLRPDAIVTLSLGVATLRPGRQDDVRHLLEAADSNLYTAKRTGRNMVCVQGLGPDGETVGAVEPPRAKRWGVG